MQTEVLNVPRDVRRGHEAHPRYVVWELTLKCDLACRHCGSRAGRPRAEELDLAEARDVVAQLAAAGTREVTLIGGEAYLSPHWLEITRALTDAGIIASMTTGARGITPELAGQAADAGMRAMSVSIDGMEATHDRLRAVPGSWKRAVTALGTIREAGMAPHANTQWNRLNMDEAEPLAAVLRMQGVKAWQVQVTGPMGRASDREDWLLQPAEVEFWLDADARLHERLRYTVRPDGSWEQELLYP